MEHYQKGRHCRLLGVPKTESPAYEGPGLCSVGGGIKPQDLLSSPQQIHAD